MRRYAPGPWLVGASILLGLALVACDSTSPPLPTATPVPSIPSIPSIPSVPPIPTLVPPTPVPPTVNREATATAAQAYANDLAYAEHAQTWLTQLTSSTDDLSTLLQNMTNDPSLLFDNNWRQRVATDLATIGTLDQEITTYGSVPGRFSSFQDELELTAQDLDAGAAFYTKGIDQLDGNMVLQGTAKFQSAATHLSNANNMINMLSTAVAGTPTPAVKPEATATHP